MSAIASNALLERDSQLHALREALSEAAPGRGLLVLVAAEAGGGKTALLQALIADLPREIRVLQGACDALFAPRPLGPFADVATSAGGELSRLAAGGARAYEVIGPLLDELRAKPTVLVLEDLHWADESTLDLLRLLGRRVEGLVIATYRDDELGPAHPLRIVLGDLESTTEALRLRLPPLTSEAVRELAEPHGVDATDLYEKTGVPRAPRSTTQSNPAGLTSRQLEVLALVSEGLPNSAIAERLVLSERTVDHHVSAILGKLGVGTRVEASSAARRLGIAEDQ